MKNMVLVVATRQARFLGRAVLRKPMGDSVFQHPGDAVN